VAIKLPDNLDITVWNDFKGSLPSSMGDKIKKLNAAWDVIDGGQMDYTVDDVKKVKAILAEAVSAASKAVLDLEKANNTAKREYKYACEVEADGAKFQKALDKVLDTVKGLKELAQKAKAIDADSGADLKKVYAIAEATDLLPTEKLKNIDRFASDFDKAQKMMKEVIAKEGAGNVAQRNGESPQGEAIKEYYDAQKETLAFVQKVNDQATQYQREVAKWISKYKGQKDLYTIAMSVKNCVNCLWGLLGGSCVNDMEFMRPLIAKPRVGAASAQSADVYN
jgi:hypothetical protein